MFITRNLVISGLADSVKNIKQDLHIDDEIVISYPVTKKSLESLVFQSLGEVLRQFDIDSNKLNQVELRANGFALVEDMFEKGGVDQVRFTQ
ncbi:hypothetical protein Q9X98_004184 [Vibrio parahaemolyticus]|uniref:hypothetical protein n=1 Tax=Vibrio alginolyticus TaxID=663 RepID=UPI00128B2988|nr:hypothetical protein [Vibrio alginolyticus]ELA7322552.1 hypothetical protein [Vibrio parahaemolyticus]MCQ9070916.1 hypothetical protein [Vibrio alginolyticus]MCR9484115.1 hypothetical protein [Vibrio alginolyticus]MDM4739716.1 hypothetical protein [Vibrio alginolyticus]MDM4760065.1 hypothetical protein [Vibrio alginolyticus]